MLSKKFSDFLFAKVTKQAALAAGVGLSEAS